MIEFEVPIQRPPPKPVEWLISRSKRSFKTIMCDKTLLACGLPQLTVMRAHWLYLNVFVPGVRMRGCRGSSPPHPPNL
jgi:hypothetical protein